MLVGVPTDAPMSSATAVGAPALADLLALPALAGARLVPNDADVTIAIRALVPLDTGAATEADALVIAPQGVADAPAGAAAVIARVAPDAVPDVPVVVIATTASWSAVLTALSEAIGLGARASADAARAALRGPLLAGEGYAALAEVASTMLGAPVAIVDPYLDTVGMVGVDEAQIAALEEAVERARAAEPSSVAAQFLAADIAGTVREPIPGPAGNVGVVVVWRSDELNPTERAALAEVVEACALEHARDEARVQTEARLRGELVKKFPDWGRDGRGKKVSAS
jgi:hypothetical protein